MKRSEPVTTGAESWFLAGELLLALGVVGELLLFAHAVKPFL